MIPRIVPQSFSECARLWIYVATFFVATGSASIRETIPFRSNESTRAGSWTRIEAAESGLIHVNHYRDPRMWTSRYLVATAGATGTGLAIADFDGDGLDDIFAVFREGQNRLYRNLGGLTFQDASAEAGILPSLDWSTGATAFDLEGDGDFDIYVCVYNAPNQLYVNDGQGGFEEQAFEFGLDYWGASNAAYFSDYDRDGDLDLFLQTNQLEEENQGQGQLDLLYRNDGADGFIDVSNTAGLKRGPAGQTLGHSALWFDFDGDGWQDIYVANDFEAPDFLYRNQGDGTFEDVAHLLPHVPYSSMGSDLGDVNNDGQIDFLVADMATLSFAKHAVSMQAIAAKTLALPASQRPAQVMKNSLFLGQGEGRFIDVAYAWNLAATDWTWAARLADFDNDGWQDAFFTNGMLRQFHNADLSYQQDQLTSKSAKNAVFPRSPVLSEDNLFFRNREGHGFEPANERWAYQHHGVSFGAAFGDLDRDGDIDVVYSNFNEPLSIWRNDLDTGNAVQVVLNAGGANPLAIGATVRARLGARILTRQSLANRGYQSSDSLVFHFGLGEAVSIDELAILWPDGTRQVETNLAAGFRYAIDKNAQYESQAEERAQSRLIFRSRSAASGQTAPAAGRRLPLYPFKDPPREGATRTLKADFNNDGFLDTLIGRRGRNNDIVFRGGHQPKLDILTGSFRGREVPLHLSSYAWRGKMRIRNGLIELAKHASYLPRAIGSFKRFGELDTETFIRLSGFQETSRESITVFDTGLRITREHGSFELRPLPFEFQYGVVQDLEAIDLNRDGKLDVIALLGYASPHVESPQPDAAFVLAFLNDGDANLRPDSLPLTDKPIGNEVVGVSQSRQGVTFTTANGDEIVYQFRP